MGTPLSACSSTLTTAAQLLLGLYKPKSSGGSNCCIPESL